MTERAAPAEVAALLHRHLARLDAERRTRAALIEALDAYSASLKVTNARAGQIAGRLRRAAAQLDADAELFRRERCPALAGRPAA
jgi:hypothetical protein